MKKFLRALTCTVLALSMFNLSFAGTFAMTSQVSDETIEAFDFDESEVYSQFDEITELETMVASSDVTYSELETENASLLEGVNNTSMIPVPMTQDEMDPPLFSGFLWGCVFSWVGIIVVYLTTADGSPHRKKAVTGCVVSGVLSVGITAAYYIWIAASFGGVSAYY